MSARDILRQAQLANETGLERVITPAHTKWMEHTKGEVYYSPEAIQYAQDVWAGKFKKARDGRFSPSSLGQCERRIMLQYRDAPQDPVPVKSLDQMYLGTLMHLSWQMEGLSAGWLLQGETFVHDGYRLGGSMDGILHDDSVFELKSTRSQLFSKIVSKEQAPKWDHLLQIEAYFRCSGRNRASLLYQDRDSGETHEFRVKSDPRVEDALDELLERLHGYVDIDTLPQVLSDCEEQTGWVYARCPVKTECLSLRRAELGLTPLE